MASRPQAVLQFDLLVQELFPGWGVGKELVALGEIKHGQKPRLGRNPV